MLPLKPILDLKRITFVCSIPILLFLGGCATPSKNKGPNETEILNRKLSMIVDQMQQQTSTVARLQSRVDQLAREKEQLASAVASSSFRKSKENSRQPRVIPVQKLHPPKEDAENEWSPDPGTTVADSSHESMHVYFQGLDEQRGQNYEKALKHFRNFLESAPTHVYADRAQFQIENTHYLNKEYSLAVAASNDLETRYSYSLKLPEALYLRAMSYSAMGQEEPMRATLARLLKYFPEDPAAEAATKTLAFSRAAGSPVPLMPKGRR